MNKRVLIINLLGAIVICFGFMNVIAHLDYLVHTRRPSTSELIDDLNAVANAFSGTRISSYDVIQKQTVFSSASMSVALRNNQGSMERGFEEMSALGWDRANTRFGQSVVFCRKDIVAEIDPQLGEDTARIQVSWGNADSQCRGYFSPASR